mgnify:FL=1
MYVVSTFDFECGEIRMNRDVVTRGSYESRKTDVVPGEDLAISRTRNESLGHVPVLVDEIWRFFAGTSTVCVVRDIRDVKGVIERLVLTTLWPCECDNDGNSEE